MKKSKFHSPNTVQTSPKVRKSKNAHFSVHISVHIWTTSGRTQRIEKQRFASGSPAQVQKSSPFPLFRGRGRAKRNNHDPPRTSLYQDAEDLRWEAKSKDKMDSHKIGLVVAQVAQAEQIAEHGQPT
jgi:hypothetical protein